MTNRMQKAMGDRGTQSESLMDDANLVCSAGVGMSFNVQLLMMQEILDGRPVIIIDPKVAYAKEVAKNVT